MRLPTFRHPPAWVVPFAVLASFVAAKLLRPYLPLQSLEARFSKEVADQLGFDIMWGLLLFAWSAHSGILGKLGLGRSDGGGGPFGSVVMRCVYTLLFLLFALDCLTWSRPDLPLIPILVAEAIIAFTEELGFRGVLLAPYKKHLFLDIWPACVSSAIIFGLLHIQNWLYNPLEPVLQQILGSIDMGLLYAAVRVFCGSLWPNVAFHALLNTKVISLSEPGTPFHSLPLHGWRDVVWLFVCFSGIATLLIALRHENKLGLQAFLERSVNWIFGKHPRSR